MMHPPSVLRRLEAHTIPEPMTGCWLCWCGNTAASASPLTVTGKVIAMNAITPEQVKKAKWKADVFIDLADGGYRQQYTCVEFPRLSHHRWADKRTGPHHRMTFLDGKEIESKSDVIAAALNASSDRQEAARTVEPKDPKPCDCIRLHDDQWWIASCDCRNGGDSDRASQWCESMNNATAIRARKKTSSSADE